MYVTLNTLLKLDPSDFDKVTEINISYNKLETFPRILIDNIHKFVNLKILYCNNISLTELPDLSAIINLKILYCNNNRLTELPDLSANINLKYLFCYNNKFNIEIPETNIINRYNQFLIEEKLKFRDTRIKSARK